MDKYKIVNFVHMQQRKCEKINIQRSIETITFEQGHMQVNRIDHISRGL